MDAIYLLLPVPFFRVCLVISSVEFNIHRLSLQYEAEHDAAGEQGKGKERGQDVRRLCREKKKKKITTFCNMHLPKDGSKYPSMELGSFSDML